MKLFNCLLFPATILSALISNVSCTYTHAAFVNDIRQSRQRNVQSRNVGIPDPTEEYSLQMNNTALFGLPRCSSNQCKRIGVVGAGISGLIIAHELTRAGHQVTVFEANERLGGRLFTYDTGKTIIELGGMRLPLDIHTLTNTYIRERFHLPLEPFLTNNSKTFVYINGVKRQSGQTSYLPSDYNLSVNFNEQNKTPFERWNEAVQPLSDLFFSRGWDSVIEKYGSYNVRQYLTDFGLSSAMIDYIGLMLGIETNFFTALTSHFRDTLLINEHTRFYHIIGGNKHLIERLAEPCQINNSTTVLSIHRNENRTVHINVKNSMNTSETLLFDNVVVTTTGPAARFIHYTPNDQATRSMTRALRQLHYDCASKIVFYFNRSWWNEQNISGGLTTTDLPLRFIYYDNYQTRNNETNSSEYVLLASYTFAQDSTFWSSSTSNQITDQALFNLEQIHSTSDIRNSHLRTVVQHWCSDSFSHGAYGLYLPYQGENLTPILMESFDELVYFAGEHLSSAHGWVEGAILSALRVLIKLEQEQFDIVIVGGGLLSLQTAIELVNRQSTWTILILEEYSLFNTTCYNQFEPSSSNRTTKDYLEFGPNITNGQFNSTQLMERFHFQNLPDNYQGRFNGKLEFVNTTKMITDSLNILKQDKYSNITIRQNERFISIIANEIITNRATIRVHHKILFLDNCYLNDYIQQSLQPCRLNLKMERFPVLSLSSNRINSLPTWLYNDQLLAFHLNHHEPQQKIVLLNSDVTNASLWLNRHLSALINTNLTQDQNDYKQTTLTNQGHIIDYLPNSNNRSIIFLGRTNIDFYPLWTNILTDLTFDIYRSTMSNYSISFYNKICPHSSTPLPTQQTPSNFSSTINTRLIYLVFMYFILLQNI